MDKDEIKRLKVIQTACSDKNSFFLLNSGIIYATGANDRWQCSEIDEAKVSMDLIEDEFLNPVHLNELDLAERGGPTIPDCAAKIIEEVQRMQSISEPYHVPIFKKGLKQDLQIK